MCHRGCNLRSGCAFLFGAGLMVAVLFESKCTLFFAGAAVIVVSLCLRRR